MSTLKDKVHLEEGEERFTGRDIGETDLSNNLRISEKVVFQGTPL